MSTDSIPDAESTVDPTGWTPTDTEVQAERALLGAMMVPLSDGQGGSINSPAISESRRVLDAGHFFRPAHQAIMAAICHLEDTGVRGIDPIAVSAELERRGDLNRVGGGVYLFGLTQEFATAASVGTYVDIVLRAFKRRAAIEYARTVQQLAAGVANDDEADITASVDKAHQDFISRTANLGANDLVTGADSAWLLADILDTWGQPTPGSMTTGLPDVDEVLDVSEGGLVVVGADSGVGKSIWLAQLARHYVFDRGEAALVFSLEMSRRELYTRDLSALARVRHDSATGKTEVTDFERRKLAQAAARYRDEGWLMIHDDTEGINLAHIRARMSQVRRSHGGIGIVCLDYVGLMDLPRADREDQQIGEVSKACKQLAREFECIFVLASQLNGEPGKRVDGRPRADDLRGSKRLKHDADVVMLLHDVAKYGEHTGIDHPRCGEVDLILDKQRKGRTATIPLGDGRSFSEFNSLSRAEPSNIRDIA